MVQCYIPNESETFDQHRFYFVVIDLIASAGLFSIVSVVGNFYPKLICEFID